MPVLILLNDAKKLLSCLTKNFSFFDIEIHENEFNETKSILSNMSHNKLYILLNCDLKPSRYEIYCLVKKQECGYCIISSVQLSEAKHDNPHVVIEEEKMELNIINEITKYLNTNLHATTAHRRMTVNNNNYLSTVKNIINRVNIENKDLLDSIKKDCEYKLLKMLNLNKIEVNEVERLYKKMLEENSN
ncbi:hypothetical protein NCER_101615 [Vairimorpha ceranae BRL01]|uniref:Uncharacterized protein n=1 Tax=Vairimorpha ceranae (strain BRL01) TaxID=578460 RepID=C4VAE9_VAIC1|nr:hypothetical protein NCER_101615 [Vairimorpha ceranae BRL01]